MPKSLPLPETLHKLLRYNPETGALFWRARTPDMFSSKRQAAEHNCAIWNGRFANKAAFTANTNWGYKQSSVFDQKMLAHRVAWAMHYGEWPRYEIDHINGIRSDNRISNLRDVTSSENGRNSQRMKNNTSGQTGVSWDRSRDQWVAYIRASGRILNLGRFLLKGDAIAARKAAEVEHGYHQNHGR